jgi:tetratricopeptide (TPR) repeat protein
MIEAFVILVAIIGLQRALAGVTRPHTTADLGGKAHTPQLAGMLDYAARLAAERKYVAAEKAYLGVLKLDHKHTAAYIALGGIYIAGRNYPDAIECYLIATQLAPTAGHYQLLGQAYYDNGNYIKSIAQLEKAIMFEPSAVRYFVLARAYSKIANYYKAVGALEHASELDPNARVLSALADAYEATKDRDRAAALRSRVKQLRSGGGYPTPGSIVGSN